MVPVCALLVTLALVSPAAARQARPASDNQRLADIRSEMARTLRSLPNYVCLETIERSRRPRPDAPLMPVDRLKFEVAHIGSNEVYSWPGERRLGEQELSVLTGGGLSGTGAFGLLAHTLFVSNSPSFHYGGEENRKGRHLVRYDFYVPARFGSFLMDTNGKQGYAGQRGSFWADARTLELVRIHSEAEDIPAIVGIRASLTDIEYQRTAIADSGFLLPARAELRVRLAQPLGKPQCDCLLRLPQVPGRIDDLVRSPAPGREGHTCGKTRQRAAGPQAARWPGTADRAGHAGRQPQVAAGRCHRGPPGGRCPL